MTVELTALVLAALLQVLQFTAYSIAANRQVGLRVSTGTREDPPTLTGTAGRLQRAFNNHFEGLILFGIACVVVTLSDQSTYVTGIAALVYLLARVAYVPAYVLGWRPWRSLIWLCGLGATVVMLLATLV